MVPMPDYSHVARTVQDRARELGYTQEDLIQVTGLGRTTVQRIWGGTVLHEPTPKTKRAMDAALQWEAGSFDIVLAGGNPTPAGPSARPSAPATDAEVAIPVPTDVPLAVQALLRFGTLVGSETFTVNMDGEEVKIGVFATSRSAIDKLVSQYERLGEVTGQVKRTFESGQDQSTPDSTSGTGGE